MTDNKQTTLEPPDRIWINNPAVVTEHDQRWWYENPMAFPTVEYTRVSAASTAPVVDEIEKSVPFVAYNQAIEDALAAIRAESQGGRYWAAAYINAIARRCSPHVYVNRLGRSTTAPAPSQPAREAETQAREIVDAFRYKSPPVQSLRFLEWEPLVEAIAQALRATALPAAAETACLNCSHDSMDSGGSCTELVLGPTPLAGMIYCGCKCVFPASTEQAEMPRTIEERPKTQNQFEIWWKGEIASDFVQQALNELEKISCVKLSGGFGAEATAVSAARRKLDSALSTLREANAGVGKSTSTPAAAAETIGERDETERMKAIHRLIDTDRGEL
ncbi:MAG TPA: hypothetical protein VFR78_12465 [Pyrinomonadaceae bacterium]|nr:hypothetical protein [Pyrinomonadaceae bacterium]